MWKILQNTLKLNTNLIKVLENNLNFDKITKVQSVVIPEFLKNKDVIVKSCTGSGKTLAYLLPMLQYMINHVDSYDGSIKNKTLAVIMLPSRELSIQVFNILLNFISNFEEKYKFSTALIIGGKKLHIDLDKLQIEIPNIIVATPGRLVDIEEKLNLSFKDLQILILDEADKMFELGFEVKVTNLIEKFPKQRRTGLFSATINSQIENLIKAGMRNPIFVDIKVNFESLGDNEEIFITEEQLLQILNKKKKRSTGSFYQIIEFDFSEKFADKKEEIFNSAQEVPIQLKQYYVEFDNIKNKLSYLTNLIKLNKENKKIMIFFATCNSVDYFSITFPKLLENEVDYSYFKLHSKISQKKRKTEYKKFLKVERGILLTTDLSARGIDIPNVDLIIQYDPPKNEEVYIHRVGRTARVGHEGNSILFLEKNELKFLNLMKQKNINIFPFDKLVVSTDESDNLLKKLREINISDKWIYDKAVKTFVSFTRFYLEHDLKYIFDIKMLDVGNLANSLSLLRIPRIREILGKKIENFTQDPEINPKDLIYLNANTAKQMEIKEM
jgi:ATP-dependent RNA helicase DDX55/SPB4